MKKKRLFPIIMASLMSISIMSAFPMGASAADNNYDTDSFADGSVNTTNLKKVLVVEDDANIPACSFTFKASAGAPVDATSDTLAVLAGVGADKITYKLLDVTNNDFITTGNPMDVTKNESVGTESSSVTLDYASQKISDLNAPTPTDNVVVTDITSGDDSNTYLATKTIQLDFSQCGFTEPGVYRYIITETGTNQGVTNDNPDTRTIDVYVEDATTDETGKKLKIKGCVMYVDTVTDGPSIDELTSSSSFSGEDNKTINPNGYEVATAKKSVGFKNTYSTHDLTFGKEVTGNQGSRDKYFKFTVKITGAVAGTIYDVDISKADATSGTNAATLEANRGKDNPTSITVPENATSVSADFYLQDGQSIIIKGIADGTSYTITEAQEDYTPSASITGDRLQSDGTTEVALSISADKKSASVSDDGLTADTNVAFTNHRNGTIPTGIILSIAPTVIIGLALIGGIVFLIIRNKKRKYEE